MEKRFYKENNTWYIDLPDFLELDLGTKSNLMMVDGADQFLDYLSCNKSEVIIKISTEKFDDYSNSLIAESSGINQELLSVLGHAPVDYGMYYTVPELNNHRLWLCPVTEYVFNGQYPKLIYIKAID